jgi:hypothetical protein
VRKTDLKARSSIDAFLDTDGTDHRWSYTVHSRNNLARAYRSGGWIDEAIPLYERTLADCERFFGPSHAHTLTTRNNLSQLRKQADSGAAQSRPSPRTSRMMDQSAQSTRTPHLDSLTTMSSGRAGRDG